MRKIFIVTLGLVSLGVSTELAMARQANCTQMSNKCWAMAGTWQEAGSYCDPRYRQCLQDGYWGIAGPGTFRRSLKGTTTPTPSKTSTAVAAPARASTAAASAA